VPPFLHEGSGAIIHVASVVALAPEIFPGIYAATKSFVLTCSQGLQAERGPRGLHVQAVLSAATRTEIWERSGRNADDIKDVMEVGALVDAALVGFDRRETITTRPLPAVGQWENFDATRHAMGSNFTGEHGAMLSLPGLRLRGSAEGATAIGDYFGPTATHRNAREPVLGRRINGHAAPGQSR